MPIVYDEGGAGLIDSWEDKGIWYKFTDEYVCRYTVLNSAKSLVVKTVQRLSDGQLRAQWAWPYKMHIFFNSELNRGSAVARGVPLSGAKVIHSGIDPERFSFATRKGLGVPLSIIAPGRIEPRKGQLDAVRLLAKLKECGAEGRLILVGERWVESYCSEIEREIRELELGDHVALIPMVSQDELAALYHQADICFFPSHYRTGFSRIPLEAMACGCILISYGNEGSDEIIRDGHNGFLVSPTDYQGIACIVGELMTRPEEVSDLAATARSEIEAKFSLEKYVDAIEQFISVAVETH
jgi:glycosyltransferase involved in cell wall biosynthesis